LIVELISATLWGFIPIVYTNYGLYYAIAYAVFIFFSLIIAVEDWYYQEVLSALLYIPLVVVGVAMLKKAEHLIRQKGEWEEW